MLSVGVRDQRRFDFDFARDGRHIAAVDRRVGGYFRTHSVGRKVVERNFVVVLAVRDFLVRVPFRLGAFGNDSRRRRVISRGPDKRIIRLASIVPLFRPSL